MGLTEELLRPGVLADLKLYVANDAGSFVDYSGRYLNPRLKSVSDLTYELEGNADQFVQNAVTVTVDNSDRHFDKNPPAGFTTFLGHRAKVTLVVPGIAETTVGLYRIAKKDGVVTDGSTNAILKLEPLSEKLRRADAEPFKRGFQRFEARPWTWGIRELLRTEEADASGYLPGSYEIPTDPRYTYSDGLKHFSAYGHPPQWDGTTWNDDNDDVPNCCDYDTTSNLLFVGIGKNLWEYDPALDTWTNRGEDSPGAGTDVRRIFVLGNATRDVVVLKWDDTAAAPYTSTMYLNYWNRTNNTWHATTRGNWTDFFSGTWWIYNGEFKTNPTPDRQVRGRFAGSGNNAGNNVAVPFEQHLRGTQAGGQTQRETADRSTLTDGTGTPDSFAGYNLPYGAHSSWWRFAGADAVNAGLGLRVAYGNRPNVACDIDPAGGQDAIVYLGYYTSGTGKFNIRQVEVTKGSALSSAAMLAGAQETTSQIHSLTLMGAGELGYIRFTEQGGTSDDLTEFCRFTGHGWGDPTGTLTAVTPTLADASDMLTDVVTVKDYGAEWVFVKFKPGRLNAFPQYQMVYYEAVGPPSETILDSSSSYFQLQARGLVLDTYPVVYVDTATGAVKKLTSLTTTALVDDGSAPVPDAPMTADFWVGSGSDPDLWGVSRPYHAPETQGKKPAGKYHLWTYGTKNAGRVSVMDFSGMDKWEAIYALADAFHQRIAIDRDGDYVVKPRDPTATGSDEVDVDRYRGGGWESIKRMADSEVVNFMEGNPFVARLSPLETSVHIRGGSTWDGEVRTAQLDTLERRVHLRCITGGYVSSGRTRWDWRPFYASLTALLKTTYSSGTSVVLEDARDVAINDGIALAGSAQRTVTAVAGNTVTINSAFPAGTYAPATLVTIYKARDGKWSSQGVTTLNDAGGISSGDTTFTVKTADDLAVGVRLIIGPEQMTVTAIDGLSVTVTRGSNAQAHADGATIAAVVVPSGLDSPVTIGGQSITARFLATGTEQTFKAGDYVEFVTAGLRLEQQRESFVRVIDDASVATYGKSQKLGGFVNRFVDRLALTKKFNDMVTRYKNPKRRFEVTMALDLRYFLLDSFYLKSADFFPDAASNRARVIVRKVTYQLMRGRTVYMVEEA